jgi:hypothetical protein
MPVGKVGAPRELTPIPAIAAAAAGAPTRARMLAAFLPFPHRFPHRSSSEDAWSICSGRGAREGRNHVSLTQQPT